MRCGFFFNITKALNMGNNFFSPLKEPLTNDMILLCIMVLSGVAMIGIVYSCNSLSIIILLSLLMALVSVIAYCCIRKFINNQNK